MHGHRVRNNIGEEDTFVRLNTETGNGIARSGGTNKISYYKNTEK
jgi:hypothetical protein